MMLELRQFQAETLETLDAFLDKLTEKQKEIQAINKALRKENLPLQDKDYCAEAWASVKNADARDYKPRYDGCRHPVPNVCLKIPTGGGKTLIAAHAVAHINERYFKRKTGLVLWVMPSEAIYAQTAKNFKNYDHPYRKVLDFAAPATRRAAILERRRRFSPQDVYENFGVLLLMLQASARKSQEQLRMFRDSGGFIDFFPPTDAFGKHQAFIAKTKNLNTHDIPGGESESGVFLPRIVKYSLANVLRILRPILVIDEGHKAYSDTARETLQDFNPRFILELSATPKSERSNMLVDIRGETLKKEQMIKLPIHLGDVLRGDWRETLSRAHQRLKDLHEKAEKSQAKTGRYIRPILLVRVERMGKEQRKPGVIHAEDAKDYLVKELGMKPEEVRIKGTEKDEIRDDDLLSPLCPVRVIITQRALQEGWDCPFAYVLALLDRGTANTALTQMIGRVLRQPYAEATGETDLDMAHVFCFDRNVTEAVEHIQRGLRQEGLGDLKEGDITVSGDGGDTQTIIIQRRLEFRGKEIALPIVLHGKGKKMRPLDHARDILAGVEWDALRHNRQGFLLERDSLVREELIDYKESVGETYREKIKGEVNAAFFARHLSDIVPNPWQAYRIAEEFMPALSHTPDELYADRMNIVAQMREDIFCQADAAAEKLFQRKLRAKDITFNLKVTLHGWKAPHQLFIKLLIGQRPKYLVRETNESIQRGLFENYPQGNLNNFEKWAAGYLDEREAIRWWHRIAVRGDLFIQGWRKHAVYPDFAFLKKGRAKTLYLLETKGKHLQGNDDTAYKRKLFSRLETVARAPVKIGTIEISNNGEQIHIPIVSNKQDLASLI